MHALTTTLALAATAAAAHAEIVTERFDIAPIGLGIFGVQFTSDYLSSAHPGVVREVRFNAEFITSHPSGSFHDAADIGIDFQLPTESVPFWSLSGEDLGWSGAGQFTASVSTDQFDGQSLIGTSPDAFLLYFFRVYSTDDRNLSLGGAFNNSYFEVDIEIVPAPASALALLLGAPLATRRRRR